MRDSAQTLLRLQLDMSTVEVNAPFLPKCNGSCCSLWIRSPSPHTMKVELHKGMSNEEYDQMAFVHASNILTLDDDFSLTKTSNAMNMPTFPISIRR